MSEDYIAKLRRARTRLLRRRRRTLSALGECNRGTTHLINRLIKCEQAIEIIAPRVGILTPASTSQTPGLVAFRDALRELGYSEGKSILLDFRYADGHNRRLGRLASELVQIPVDVIVADGTAAARAANHSTRQIPIVQAVGGNPVTMYPSPNLTGFYIDAPRKSAERLEKLIPRLPAAAAHSVLVVHDSTSEVKGVLEALAAVAAGHPGLALHYLDCKVPTDVTTNLPGALAGPPPMDGLILIPSGMFWDHRAEIRTIVNATVVYAVYPEREYKDGTDAHDRTYHRFHGHNIPNTFRRAAHYVDLILCGAKPSELPSDEATEDTE
jgi:putative ABC transport system substrate-binding protein